MLTARVRRTALALPKAALFTVQPIKRVKQAPEAALVDQLLCAQKAGGSVPVLWYHILVGNGKFLGNMSGTGEGAAFQICSRRRVIFRAL